MIATLVAEVYGQPEHDYNDLIDAARIVRKRLELEPGVVDVDYTVEAGQTKLVFVTDKEKAALNGVTVADILATLQMCLNGTTVGTVRLPSERNPLKIELRLPRPLRSSAYDLSQIYVQGLQNNLVPLAELGVWEQTTADQTIYHKNMQPVVYVFAETAGRAPADAVVDIQADRVDSRVAAGSVAGEVGDSTLTGWVSEQQAKPVEGRTFFSSGSGIQWAPPAGFRVDFSGEGEWKITLDVFRDLGLAFAAALIAIYILLVAQTGSFIIPVVVMLAIPLTILGIMPGFWLLNVIAGEQVGQYADVIFFTATA